MPASLSRSFSLLVALSLGALSFACGDKGSDDGDNGAGGMAITAGAGGSGVTGGGGSGGGTAGTTATAELLYGFESTVEGFKYETYVPGDPMYTNVGGDEGATISWDGGTGQDGQPGRLKLEIPFTGYNQLADIQLNLSSTDWAGKTVRAYVQLESGFSPDASAPGGAYIFVKTGSSYSWARGGNQNLPPTSIGQWTRLTFPIDTPNQTASDDYDPSAVVSVGIQFYSGAGSATIDPPSPAVIYVDTFEIL